MSGSTEQRVAQALANRYQHVAKTKTDCMNLLNQYRGLAAKLDRFVFNDGITKQLLTLDGTIPVPFKGSTYNIPICLWILDTHPYSAPMAFVKPTADMLIKASRHVDQNGKIYLPYLHEWNPDVSDLIGLVQVMIMTFSEMPPVYAKPKGAPPTPAQPAMPYPTTPYPTQPSYPAYHGGAGYPPSNTGYPAPAYPPYPPPGNLPYPTPYPTPAENTLAGGSASMAAAAGNTGTITEEHIRLSLVSAVEDRVRDKLREKHGDAQAEVAVLKQQKADLERGRAKLNNMISKLQAEQNEVNKSIRVLREREAELRGLVEQSESTQKELDIDEAVTTTAPLYRQLVAAYADEQATQDAIYYLGEALRRSVLDLDTYMRHVRALSRRQYQLRATMSLCRQKANLAP
ncbi:tumor susceptibility gene 101 protein isoform X1 [Hyalella azteca]|uniref:Tumor susceptibility gene 101 protein isoform X1 n=1 Tax=Hyalella azteca TaxID=294128 RepID=A0A8B7PAK6_HYAAZ|nr:tumor susceptibility gene 101 protein isoform X1 [Hyalella azteca]